MKAAPSITVETQLSLTHILSNGLVFFAALTIRDYMSSSITFENILPRNTPVRASVKVILTLVVVAILLVVINFWKRDVEEKDLSSKR